MWRATWIGVFCAGCGGSGLQQACDDYLAAQTACIDEAWADDPAGHDEQIAALGTDCGVEDQDSDEGQVYLECLTAVIGEADCSTPETAGATTDPTPCQ